jgi:ABC-2 type transport system permease protein
MSADAPRLPANQAALFQRLRLTILRNAWRQMIGVSMLRPLTILCSTVLVALFVFVLSYAGFRFFIDVMKMPAHGLILELLVGLLFFSLGFLLVFSGGLILHGSLFSAAETAFLLSKPVAADQVFAYKFQGAVGFSSWAFLLLGGPILVAYGLVAGVPLAFYAVLPLFFLGFVLLPGSVGAILCFLIVNFLPKRRKQVLAVALVALAAFTAWWIYRAVSESRALITSTEPMAESATVLLSRISFARSLWLPSGWVARGLMAAGRGDWSATGYHLALVWSNGLFFYVLAAWTSARLYRRGFNRVATGGDLRRKHGGAWLDRAFSAMLPFVHPGTRLLIVKDFRTFRRDPQQWGQVLLFTGILVLYFGNIKRMFLREIEWPYQNGLSLLNLGSIALLLSAYTGRFIYPLLSLEGRKFWILGLLPLERDRLLWGKFAFSMSGCVVLASLMVLLSDVMLEMPAEAILLHFLTVVVLSAGLSGLSVGMGALLPNFRESDPSKIAVGFGGTLNLIAGLAFLLVILGLMALPWHLFMAMRREAEGPRSPFMYPVVIAGVLAGLVVGAAGVLVSLRAGVQALRKVEF